MHHYLALCMLKQRKSRGKFTRRCHERFCRSSITSWLCWRFSCPKETPITDCITRNRLLALLSWQRSRKIEPFTAHIVNACLEISKLLKNFKCALTWTSFKIQHRTMRNPASSSPVLNLPFLQKVVWKEDASQNQHLSSSHFWIPVIQASGCLWEGKENIIYCGQWSPWAVEGSQLFILMLQSSQQLPVP